nr:CBO0543 family protein [Lysinibacillus timonensis]
MEPQTIFVYVVSLVFIILALLIPKKIKRYEMYATSLFSVVVGLVVDTMLAVKYEFYVLDKPGVQIPPIIGQVILYYIGSLLILNFYPYQKSKMWKAGYILFCSLLAVGFEFICYIFNFINYNQWKIWYSALCYPFIISFFVLHFKFFRWLVKESKE